MHGACVSARCLGDWVFTWWVQHALHAYLLARHPALPGALSSIPL